jgi:hypothetical protein
MAAVSSCASGPCPGRSVSSGRDGEGLRGLRLLWPGWDCGGAAGRCLPARLFLRRAGCGVAHGLGRWAGLGRAGRGRRGCLLLSWCTFRGPRGYPRPTFAMQRCNRGRGLPGCRDPAGSDPMLCSSHGRGIGTRRSRVLALPRAGVAVRVCHDEPRSSSDGLARGRVIGWRGVGGGGARETRHPRLLCQSKSRPVVGGGGGGGAAAAASSFAWHTSQWRGRPPEIVCGVSRRQWRHQIDAMVVLRGKKCRMVSRSAMGALVVETVCCGGSRRHAE